MSAISWNPEVTKSSIVAQHVEQWRSKSLHGQWPCLLQDRNYKSSGWLSTAHLKPVTEALLTAAQDQAVCTNWLACHILGTAVLVIYVRSVEFSQRVLNTLWLGVL